MASHRPSLSWILILSLQLLLLSGCSTMCQKSHTRMSAEEVVEAYLTKAFNMNSVNEVVDLIALTSGNLKQALEEADASTIDRIFVQSKYTVEQFLFVERKDLTAREVVITYNLSYQRIPPAAATTTTDKALIHIENSLSLIRKEGAWFITDVIGGQTTIDFLMDTEITAGSN